MNADDKAVVGYLHPGTVHSGFVRSLINLMAYDGAHSRRMCDGGGVIECQAGANLAGPRNDLVRSFLKQDVGWLLMVDSDMTFPPDALDRLMDKADRDKRPIVGGLCFGLEADGTHSPTLFDVCAGPDGAPQVVRHRNYPPDMLVKLAGTGAAFLLVHRSVFERFDSHEPTPGTSAFSRVYPYFQETEYFGKPISEDLTFCFRAGFLNIPTYVDTGCVIGHLKTRQLDATSFAAQRHEEAPPCS